MEKSSPLEKIVLLTQKEKKTIIDSNKDKVFNGTALANRIRLEFKKSIENNNI